MGRQIIVGDVHGMLAELHQLVDLVDPQPSDVVVFCGDLVDKGPDSPGVVAYVRELQTRTLVMLVRGNHEDKHARYRLARAKVPPGQTVRMSNVDEMEAITAALSSEDIAFLDSAVWFHRVPDHNAVVVHGGILPVTQTLDAEDKAMRAKLIRVRHVTGQVRTRLTIEFEFPYEVVWTDVSKALQTADWSEFTVVRRVTRPVGEFIPLGDETTGDPFWADVYDGRFGHVYFGHSPFINADQPVLFPHATGLDLGAVHGNRLAAAILTPGETSPKYVTVKASAKYATSLWEEE